MADESEDKKEISPEHINLRVLSSDGNEVFFKIKRSTPFRKLMDAYCQRQGKSSGSLRFLFDGNRILADQTPENLDMEDNDVIDVQIEQVGGS